MRIVLAHSHVNTLGGGERAILELGRELMQRHQLRLLLGGFDPSATYPELASLPHSRLGRLQWPFSRVDADAIVANSFGANLLSLRNGPRVAYWVHSTRSLFLRPGSRRLDLRLRRVLDWLAVRRSAQLVANSRYTAGRLWQLYRREADAIVYPGVDLALFRPGTGGDAAYAITVGRLSPKRASIGFSNCGATCLTCRCTLSAADRPRSCASCAQSRPAASCFVAISHRLS